MDSHVRQLNGITALQSFATCDNFDSAATLPPPPVDGSFNELYLHSGPHTEESNGATKMRIFYLFAFLMIVNKYQVPEYQVP